MAGCMIVRRLNSKFPKFRTASHEQSTSARAFATAAAKVPDDSSVEVERRSETKASPNVIRDRALFNQNRGRPANFSPGVFSPFLSDPSSFMRPTSLMQMMDTMDRVFSSAEPLSFGGLRSRTPWDAMEDDKCFKIRMDMPGMTKNDVKITVEDGDLVVKAEHNKSEGEDDWSSRASGTYNARIKLPDNIEIDAIKAEVKDGVLKVIAPKTGTKQKREVKID
ncbi:hypothetical protein KP509_14G068800 [Ceratopteris richardii]|uniref:SHSP domain-containing protein n=1 Tax=Ceratopteris richardii TaxID=49495 RepID=A0A8T2TAV9_CERRI|nr:hypothetical protein KP509_14G068800 [Ceratopteris richardii]